jgi:hypothetical protein
LLAPDQLKEPRLLTNAAMDSRGPFALLLVGQPTLARQLQLGECQVGPLRIATRYQVAAMDLAEAAQCRQHHLALVGPTDPLFALRRSRHKANYPEPGINAVSGSRAGRSLLTSPFDPAKYAMTVRATP